MSGFVYLASPYSDPLPSVRQWRFEENLRVAAELMTAGLKVFSPIAHTHLIPVPEPLLTDHDFWLAQDIPILRCAAKLIVLTLPGWEQSRGVTREIEVARACQISIEYFNPNRTKASER